MTEAIVPVSYQLAKRDPKAFVKRPRYSMPFLTLPDCIAPDRPDRYPEPILADDYLRERLREIKLLY